MSIIKRLYATVSASVDQLVGEIENHDAVIDAAIREQRKKLATAKVQLKRLQENELRAAQDIVTLEAKQRQWVERARKAAAADEGRALACLQQRHQAAEQMERLQHYRQQYRKASAALAADIHRCEDDLLNLSQKQELFRARQSSSNALNVVNDMGVTLRDDLCRSFERWDATIIEKEMMVACLDEPDCLEQQFIEEEHRNALRSELQALLAAEELPSNITGVQQEAGEGSRHE